MDLFEELNYWRQKSNKDHFKREYKEQYYRMCYEICNAYGWSYKDLESIERKTYLSPTTIRNYAKEYLFGYLKLSVEEVESIYKDSDFCPVKSTLREEKYKKCYELCENYGWRYRDLEAVDRETGLVVSTIRSYARKYALGYLGMSEEEFNKKIGEKTYILKDKDERINIIDTYISLLESLISISANKVDDIVMKIEKYVFEKRINVVTLKRWVPTFVVSYHSDKKNILIKDLEKKLDIYLQYVKPKTEKKERKKELTTKELVMPEVVEVMNFFIESNYETFELFCINEQIEIEYFVKMVSYCKKYDKDLFQKYCNKISVYLLPLVKSIIYFIKNGVMNEDGTIRNFDIIDYYILTKISINDLVILIGNNLSLDEEKIFKNFFGKNKLASIGNSFEEEQICSGAMKIGCFIRDNDNNLVNYYPNSEEVNDVLSFLEEQQIPINRSNYSNAMKKYLNDILPLNCYNSLMDKKKHIKVLR